MKTRDMEYFWAMNPDGPAFKVTDDLKKLFAARPSAGYADAVRFCRIVLHEPDFIYAGIRLLKDDVSADVITGSCYTRRVDFRHVENEQTGTREKKHFDTYHFETFAVFLNDEHHVIEAAFYECDEDGMLKDWKARFRNQLYPEV